MNNTSGGEESSLPWNLVMESLAGVEDIDTVVLENLMKIVPRGYESLDPSAKERLALRRMFELFAETNEADTTNVSSTSGLFVIDVAESAQDVYNHILSKMQTSNLPDSLKLEICQFAIQKKGHLPKCRLQQLKEALKDSGVISNEILRNVLCVQLARSKDHLNNGTEIQTPLLANQENHSQEVFRAKPSNTSSKDGTVQVLENSAPVPSAQDVAGISKHCRNVGVPQPVDEISSDSAPKKMSDRVRVDHANDHFVTGKRRRCEFGEDSLLDSTDTDKKNEIGHSSDQMFVHEALESSHGKNILLVQSEATAAAQVQGIDGCGRTSKRLRALAESSQTEDQEVTMEEASDKVQDPNAVKLPDKSQASILYSQEDMTVIQSSPVDQNSVEAEWTQENLCMKCNKGDQLLVCCVETCPIIVHERCLASSTDNFDTMGKFYCPSCSYSQALAAYHEAKKKVVLMRDRLDKFLNLKIDPKKQKESDMKAPKDTGNDHVDAEALGKEEPRLEPPPVSTPQTGEAIDNQQSLESRQVTAPPESSGRASFRIPPESLDRPLVTNEPRESSDRSLGNQAQKSNAILSIHCNSVNDSQGAVRISKEPLVGLSVNAPKGQSRPLEKIVESHCAGTKRTLTDQEVAAADVGVAARHVQEPTSSDQSEDVSAEGTCDEGIVFRKRNTHPPLRQIITKTRRVKTKWTEAEVAILEEGMKKFMNSPTKWNDILEFGRNVFNPCRMGGDLKDKWRNMHH